MGKIYYENGKFVAAMNSNESKIFDCTNPAKGLWSAKKWLIEKAIEEAKENEFPETFKVEKSIFDYAENIPGFVIKEQNRIKTIVPEGMTLKKMNFLFQKEAE